MVNLNIKPFVIVENDESPSVIMCDVGSFKQNIFNERAEEGFEGNGYDWASLAKVFLDEKLPHLANDVRMDPEGSMFCAYSVSANMSAVREFAEKFYAACQDDDLLRDLFSRAELD